MAWDCKLFIVEDTFPEDFELISPETLEADNGDGDGFGDDGKGQRMPDFHIDEHPDKGSKIKGGESDDEIDVGGSAEIESSEIGKH